MVHMESFPYRLADNKWHKIALSISGTEIQLIVDCHPLYKRVTHYVPDRNFSASNMQLLVGQRNLNSHSLFKVSWKQNGIDVIWCNFHWLGRTSRGSSTARPLWISVTMRAYGFSMSNVWTIFATSILHSRAKTKCISTQSKSECLIIIPIASLTHRSFI